MVTAAAAAVALAFGVASALVGGFDLPSYRLRLSVRDPWQPLAIGAVLALVSLALARRASSERRGRVGAFFVAAACVIVVLLVLSVRGAFVAAGAEASGNVSQAALWERRSLQYVEPLVTAVEWEDKRLTLSPIGYRPSLDGASQVPTSPPGLPMLMAVGRHVKGEAGGYAVVPLIGLVLVAATALAAFQAGGPWASAFAAVLVALSPTFLHHVVQPTSDVPAACLWTLALWAAWRARGMAGALGAGTFAAAAILVRPHLAPLGAIVVWLAARGEAAAIAPWKNAAVATAATSIGGLATGALQWHLHGSPFTPFTSGYGEVSRLLSASHVPTNVVHVTSWLAGAEPFLLVGLAAPLAFRGPADRARRRLAAAAVATLGVIVALYAFGIPFDNWTSLRFLLPAFPLLAVASGTVLARTVGQGGRATWIGCATLALLVASNVALARANDALGAQRATARFRVAANYVNRYLPTDVVILSAAYSGTLRYYTGRSILRFDRLRPDLLDDALAQVKNLGRPVVFILDEAEVEAVRRRFAATSAVGRLDVLPRTVLREATSIYVFDVF